MLLKRRGKKNSRAGEKCKRAEKDGNKKRNERDYCGVGQVEG